ncbi:hypothetical protein ACRARG_12705 [Pseudooceanicola sp. C21-150M6]|uniref:hypothetical protein n=1 Tax=Pseudooceanicola sp. C21-150M6 TaxID=3434355 RepID=UPI003D7FC5E8
MKPDTRDLFWMICRTPTGRHSKTEPRARYSTFEAAWDDAAKLARETGMNFSVLAHVDIVTPGDRLTQSSLFKGGLDV